MTWRLIEADCIEAMQQMEDSSVDAIVTDPPYGIHFMGKTWDRFGGATGQNTNDNSERGGAMHAGTYDLSPAGQHGFQAQMTIWATESLRVLRPGGHLVAFGGTRTIHRLICAIEDAGFEIRDMLSWLFGSGFPKSLNVGNGFGTALKPAWEGITLARKPLIGTVAANVLEHGTGALNIDGTRIGTETVQTNRYNAKGDMTSFHGSQAGNPYVSSEHAGRWPANVVLDEAAAALLDEQTGERPSTRANGNERDGARGYGSFGVGGGTSHDYRDTGGASRFFYVAKSASAERNRGLAHRESEVVRISPKATVAARSTRPRVTATASERTDHGNTHPTVKPVELMQWLCRLITPPNGTVLDPFTGSGSTGIAALREGFSFIGIEREHEYVEIARDRIIGDAPLFNTHTEESG